MARLSDIFGKVVADVKLEMGSVEEALNLLDEVQQLSIESHQQIFLFDLHRVRAEALRRIDPKCDHIGNEFHTALELARRQGAISLESRTGHGSRKLVS